MKKENSMKEKIETLIYSWEKTLEAVKGNRCDDLFDKGIQKILSKTILSFLADLKTLNIKGE